MLSVLVKDSKIPRLHQDIVLFHKFSGFHAVVCDIEWRYNQHMHFFLLRQAKNRIWIRPSPKWYLLLRPITERRNLFSLIPIAFPNSRLNIYPPSKENVYHYISLEPFSKKGFQSLCPSAQMFKDIFVYIVPWIICQEKEFRHKTI